MGKRQTRRLSKHNATSQSTLTDFHSFLWVCNTPNQAALPATNYWEHGPPGVERGEPSPSRTLSFSETTIEFVAQVASASIRDQQVFLAIHPYSVCLSPYAIISIIYKNVWFCPHGMVVVQLHLYTGGLRRLIATITTDRPFRSNMSCEANGAELWNNHAGLFNEPQHRQMIVVTFQNLPPMAHSMHLQHFFWEFQELVRKTC